MKLDQTSLDLAELAWSLTQACNRADGTHAWQMGGTYGDAHQATETALTIGLTQSNPAIDQQAGSAIAARVIDEAVSSGESIAYCLAQLDIDTVPSESE